MGLFGGGHNIAALQGKYGVDRKRLLDFLKDDLRLIEKEKAELEEAVKALEQEPQQLQPAQFTAVFMRLELIKHELSSADKLASDQLSHIPSEKTLLNLLEEIIKLYQSGR